LAINFFLKEKYKKKKKKRKRNRDRATLLAKMGWLDHRIFGATPMVGLGVVHGQGSGPITPKRPKKKKKKKKKKKREWILVFWGCSNLLFLFFGLLGWLDHPLAMGVIQPPPKRSWGWLQSWGGQNGVSTPDFFFFIIIIFYIFLLKKLMVKTTSFWIR
jgi:hypothetical protein